MNYDLPAYIAQFKMPHCVFYVIWQAKFTNDLPCEMSSKIHLVDLAGRYAIMDWSQLWGWSYTLTSHIGFGGGDGSIPSTGILMIIWQNENVYSN